MSKHQIAGLFVATAIAAGLAYGFIRSETPESPPHATHVTKAQRAFCNCLKVSTVLSECLSSAEQGDGRDVDDQELLLSRCLESRARGE